MGTNSTFFALFYSGPRPLFTKYEYGQLTYVAAALAQKMTYKNNLARAQQGAREVHDFQTANKVSVVRPRMLLGKP